MLLGHKIRSIRQAKSLSQGDIEARTGLLRSYVSRVEHGHIVPSLETLEKIANAFQIPLYQLFREETDPLPKPIRGNPINHEGDWAISGSGEKEFRKLRANLGKLNNWHRALLLHLAQRMTRQTRAKR